MLKLIVPCFLLGYICFSAQFSSAAEEAHAFSGSDRLEPEPAAEEGEEEEDVAPRVFVRSASMPKKTRIQVEPQDVKLLRTDGFPLEQKMEILNSYAHPGSVIWTTIEGRHLKGIDFNVKNFYYRSTIECSLAILRDPILAKIVEMEKAGELISLEKLKDDGCRDRFFGLARVEDKKQKSLTESLGNFALIYVFESRIWESLDIDQQDCIRRKILKPIKLPRISDKIGPCTILTQIVVELEPEKIRLSSALLSPPFS